MISDHGDAAIRNRDLVNRFFGYPLGRNPTFHDASVIEFRIDCSGRTAELVLVHLDVSEQDRRQVWGRICLRCTGLRLADISIRENWINDSGVDRLRDGVVFWFQEPSTGRMNRLECDVVEVTRIDPVKEGEYSDKELQTFRLSLTDSAEPTTPKAAC